MSTKAIYTKANSTFYLPEGTFDETTSLATGVKAILKSTGDMQSLAFDETYDLLEAIGWHINDQGYRWWSDPNNQAFGSEYGGGNGNWGIYKQSNIYTTARRHAGKNGSYGVHIFRYPNISADSTWGGLSLYPPAAAKLRGHTYRFSFDYRGYTNGNTLEVYQNTTVGWGDLGIGLPTPWWAGIGAFDTDWDWRRYEYEYTIQDAYLDWVPGSNLTYWNASTQYSDWYYGVPYNGYVYRHLDGWPAPTVGVTPDLELGTKYYDRFPMTAGYFDVYNNLKIGFSYEAQGNRGTHMYIDNIQLTDITSNKSFKLTPTGWESDNMSETTMKIVAKGTAYTGINRGDGSDQFAVEGPSSLYVNDTLIYSGDSGRGLRLSIFTESTGALVFDQSYDTYGVDSARTQLANKLATITSAQVWVLTSYDAINPNTDLDTQMRAMGSRLLVNDGSIHSVYAGGGVRHPYAAVGRGQKVIKEDGCNQLDTIYKRKGVIDIRI